MNHRELVLSARKKAKFHFLQLPEPLQDELIEKLDAQELTLEAARDHLRWLGHTLSHEAIAAYYRAVRRERRLYDATQELTRVVDQFADQPLEENVRTLSNFLIATAVRQIADGEVGIKDVDLAKVIQAIAKTGTKSEAKEQRPEDGEQKPDRPAIPDAELIKQLRQQFL
jgi:hypothetical protein